MTRPGVSFCSKITSSFPDENKAYSRRFVQNLGCASKEESFEDVDAIEKILVCVRSKTEQEILLAQSSFKDEVEVFEGAWVDDSDGVSFCWTASRVSRNPGKM